MSRPWHTAFASFTLTPVLCPSPCSLCLSLWQAKLYCLQPITDLCWSFLNLTSCQVLEASCLASHQTFQCWAPTGSRRQRKGSRGASHECCIYSLYLPFRTRQYVCFHAWRASYISATADAHSHPPVSAVVAAAAPAVVSLFQTQLAAPGSWRR